MAGLVCLLGLASCVEVDTEQACRVVKVAEAPLRLVGALPVVDVAIDGKPAAMMIDTGAETGLVNPAAFARLGLRHDYGRPSYVTGLGGRGIDWETEAVVITLGGVALAPASLLVGAFTAEQPFDGLIGSRILAGYDIDLDIPDRRLTLYRPRRCPGGTPPFEPSMTVQAGPFGPERLSVPVVVDGKTLFPLVDTGATATLLDLARTGLVSGDLADDPVVTLATADTAGLAVRSHRFVQVRIGREIVERPVIQVAPLGAAGADGLLGADYFRTRRAWISYASRTVTVGPGGGRLVP